MAEIILSPLIHMLLNRLASPVIEKVQQLFHLDSKTERLQQSARLIQSFLEDAEEGQEKGNAVETWLLKVRDLAYDGDDLFDKLTLVLMQHVTISASKLPKNLFYALKELGEMQKGLDQITEEAFRLNLKQKGLGGHYRTIGSRETSSSVNESEVYARKEDKENIIEFLHTTSSGESIPIISIVGIGGLGKTTLAQLVYGDADIRQGFDILMWVHISKNFDIKKIVTAIIESVAQRKCEFTNLDILSNQLRESIRGKKYLLVLDDVWNEDIDEWERFHTLMQHGGKGSKIIVTTRSDKVASILGTSYHLKGLAEEDSLALFKQRAFSHGEEEEHPNLLAIAEKIAKKCGGVPLAALTLGGSLRFKREERDWLFVEENELCDVDDSKCGILPTLRLSFNHLPAHLKRCFGYCSLFPKGYNFKKQKLIHLWMAEGLIPAEGGHRPLEDIASDFFNDLLWMSFFQEVEESEDEGIKFYQMHDLIQDLAQSVAGGEFLKLEDGPPPSDLTRRTRHCSVVSSFQSSTIPHVLLEAKRLRTLLFLYPGRISEDLFSLLAANFKYLRVLNFSGCGIKRLENSIGDLTYLRYLDLSKTSIRELPHTICNFYLLQTLDLSGCCQLLKLPYFMRNLTTLQHLNISGCEGLTCMPPKIGKLVHLQTLPLYIVGKKVLEGIAELRFLNLRGELSIKRLQNVRTEEEVIQSNLKDKCLDVIKLFWEDNVGNVGLADRGTSFRWQEHILMHLLPHRNLKKLFIKGYPGITFLNSLPPTLTEVVLVNCRRCKALSNLGKLPLLKKLYLEAMEGIECIGQEFYGREIQVSFPILKELTLIDFPRLAEWSGRNAKEAFPCLEKLMVKKCPNLSSAPALPSLQHLELRCCHPSLLKSMKDLSSLKTLVIDTFPELSRLPGDLFKNNTLLTSLKISSCPNLLSLPWQIENLTALKSLAVRWCQRLEDWPQEMQNLKSLESLEITECNAITSLPEAIQGLSSLKNLSIENCDKLSLQYPSALEHLTIMYCPKLTSLPHGLHNLSALQSLNILSCTSLGSLPMELPHVKTLKTVEIRRCPSLQHLPEWDDSSSSLRSLVISDCKRLTSIPEGLLRLSALQHLSFK